MLPLPHWTRTPDRIRSSALLFRRRLGCLVTALAVSALAAPDNGAIVIDPAANPLERFAARELQRYVYVASGEVLPIHTAPSAPADASFVVTTTGQPLSRGAAQPSAPLTPQQYHLHAGGPGSSRRVTVLGGDSVGTLYGVYRLAEKLGIRFYLHGDVIPEARTSLPLAAFAETGRPLFPVRGLQPFHDFAEGPDGWNADDYSAVIGQLAKLRMNFLGLHTYPESDVGPEPTVWIGPREDLAADGQVRRAYPASYHTTGRSGRPWWAYAPVPTSEFTGGAAALFDRDEFGADVMRDHSFAQQTPESAAVVFNRTGALLGSAFAEARRLGILTCIGTETPLTLPAVVRASLAARGRNPDDPALIREIYEAMFVRIGRVSPADYFWLWTPETWTWEGNAPEAFARTAADIQSAVDALKAINSPMTLATCGWVLGPQHDRAALDHLLPPSSPMSAINSSVGHVAIERQFTQLSNRPRWAIPWLENDGNLTSPQLWAGRMRYDAADALRLGCTGLIGIHWRTRVLSPQVASLAAAAWDQSWTPADFDPTPIPPLTASGATDGRAVASAAAAGRDDSAAVFVTQRVGISAYDMLVPSGDYTVRLGFSALTDAAPGANVFSVSLNGKAALEHLDLAALPDARRGITREFTHIAVTEGRLLIGFTPHAGEPAIASIELEATTHVGRAPFRRRINCGGPAVAGYEADQLPGQPRPPIERTMPVADFYRDFAVNHFGPDAADAIAEVFTHIDGVVPMPTLWIDGPGDIRRNPEPWSVVAPAYAFVSELEALRPRVSGAANLDRFDYWLNQFRALRLIAEIGCTAGALDLRIGDLITLTEPAVAKTRANAEALPLRLRLAELWTQLLHTELAAVSTVGELGTLANLEQRSRVHQQFLTKHDPALIRLLGCDLPLAAWPARTYAGPARIIVPTVRTSAAAAESLTLRVLLLSQQTPAGGVLIWRELGAKDEHRVPLEHLARSVYRASLPALTARLPAIEYWIEAPLDGATHRWPVSDRGPGQTLILFERNE